MSRLTTLTSRQEKLKLNPPFIVTMNNTTSNIDISSNLTTNLSISSNLIINTVQNGKSIIYLGTQYSTTSALKTAIIAEGMNDWSRAKLHFCLNNMGDRGAGVLPDGNSTNYNASIADARMTITYTGNVGIGTTDPKTLFHIKGTDPILRIMAQGGGTAKSQIDLATFDNPLYPSSCSLIATDNGNGGNSFQINLKTSGNINNTQFTPFYISPTGDVGINTTTNTKSLLNLYDTVQNKARLTLTGKEFYTGENTNGDGIGLVLGVNRTDNRQLYICDTAKIAQNTTNSMIRMGVGGVGETIIDSMATDGATRLVLNIGGGAFKCQTNTYGSMNKVLKFHNVQTSDTKAIMENLIINEGAIVGGIFGGDTFISGYWGVAVNLNNSGSTNGSGNIGGNINNTQSYEPGNSAFTINMRSSTSQTTFDRRLLTVLPNGNVSATGTITGTTLSAINTNLAIPAVGAAGGNGDRLILWTGSAAAHPYSLGMNSSTLWYSVPSGASHIFYVNGGAIATISSTGISNTGTIRATGYAAVNGAYELMIDPPTATAAATIQTIQQGVNFNQNLTLQAVPDSGNVGIGTTNPSTYKLYVNGTTYINGNTTINSAKLIVGNDNSFPDLQLGSTNGNNLGVATTAGSFSGASAINDLVLRSLNKLILQSGGGNTPAITITTGNYVGIGTNNPSQILQVGDAARLRIANDSNDYSLIGTKNVDDADNTRIVISGKGRTNYNGNIDYITTTTGSHLFYSSVGTTVERMRINNVGNVGIGTTNPSTRLHIEHASTSPDGWSGGLYVYNPNDAANHCSVIGVRIGGKSADKALLSFDSALEYGWSIFLKGGDSSKSLRFNNSSNGTGTDILQISNAGNITCSGSFTNGSTSYMYAGGLRLCGYDTGNAIWQDTGDLGISANTGNNIKFGIGNGGEKMRIKSNGYVGIGTTDPKSLLTINTPPTVTDPISFDYSSCPLTITNTNTTGSTINDPKPVLFLCRNGVAGQSYGSKASFNLCRFENAGNTHSRTRLDIGLTNANFNDVNIMSLRSDGNVGIGTTNPGTYKLYVNESTYINGTLITNKIGIGNNTPVGTLHIGTSVYQSDTSLYISANNVGNRTCRMGYNSDWSFCIGDIGQSDSGTWKPQILINYAAPANSISIDSIGRVYGNFIGYSDERLKSNIQTIDNALLKVQELRGVTFTFISDNTRDIGLIAQEVEYIIPEAVKENELNNTKGINYSCLVGLLVQAVKELNNKVIKLENILINNNLN